MWVTLLSLCVRDRWGVIAAGRVGSDLKRQAGENVADTSNRIEVIHSLVDETIACCTKLQSVGNQRCG